MSWNQRYFASANSKSGFVDFFDEVFGECAYRYVLKGGPGTGKSWLMKQLGAAAEAAGYQTEYILCSSDPESLDGVIIRDLGIGMMDGTAPHMCDVRTPGIDSELVNLGIYWNKKKLGAMKEQILSLTDEKSVCYKKAYHTIEAIAEMEALIKEYTENSFDTEKATAFSNRVASRFSSKVEGKEKIRLIDGYGMNGYTVLDSFAAQINYKIRPIYLLEYTLLDLIYQSLRRKHTKMTVSYRAIDGCTVNGIYLPEHGVSFTVGTTKNEQEKQINTERFLSKAVLRTHKNKLRFASKCKTELESLRNEQFNKIKEAHFAIEECYKQAMNFKKLTQDSERLIAKILQ